MMGPTSGAFAELKVASEAKQLRLLAARREAPRLDARRRQLDERTLMGRSRAWSRPGGSARCALSRGEVRAGATHGPLERERSGGDSRGASESKSEEALQRYDERRMQRERHGASYVLSAWRMRSSPYARPTRSIVISQVDERRTQTAQRRSYEAKLQEERGRLKHLCARENYESILMARGFKNEMMRCGKHIALERRGSILPLPLMTEAFYSLTRTIASVSSRGLVQVS